MSENSGFIVFLKRSIPGTIWAIGVSSLLVNMATSVIFSGSALYLKTVLGAGLATIGWVEAFVEWVAYFVRLFSGAISDYLKKRKWLMVLGFAMLTVAKPMLAFSKSFFSVFLARTVDRIGNGIQASPRDALISDSAPKESKGACFGLRQSLAVIGSTLGGLFGIAVMKLSNANFELLFLLATIPAAIATIILILFVKDKTTSSKKKKETNLDVPLFQKRDENLKRFVNNSTFLQKLPQNSFIISLLKKVFIFPLFGLKFWILMPVVTIFMLGRFSESFISLHACGTFGLDVSYCTAITMIYNLLATLVSYPVGKISDRMNRVNLLFLGFFFLLFAHISMGYATSLAWVLFGTVLWGIQRGITEGLFAILISDYVPKELRGTCFGVYYLVVSFSTMIATVFAGWISERNGGSAAFIFGALFCSLAVILLFICRKTLSTRPANSVDIISA